MQQNHDKLLEAAKKAVDSVYTDTSVSLVTTLASLHDLRDYLDILIDAARHSE